ALPDNKGIPALLLKRTQRRSIASDIAVELCLPELGAALGGVSSGATWVPVPEAAVDKHDLATPGEHDVRAARHPFPMGAVAVAEAVQQRPDDTLWAGIPPTDGPHVLAAPLRR